MFGVLATPPNKEKAEKECDDETKPVDSKVTDCIFTVELDGICDRVGDRILQGLFYFFSSRLEEISFFGSSLKWCDVISDD